MSKIQTKHQFQNDTMTEEAIDNLLLDPENPRLPANTQRDQQSMLDYIAETTSIEELMVAIGENGFFPGEPLIVVPHTAETGKFIVVEGNRRLTAVKLLREPHSYSQLGLKISEIAKNAKHRPTQLPIVQCPSRSAVLPYLGFRHITGVKQWEPLAKARYIAQLFNLTEPNLKIKDRYDEVARTIGSRRNHIKRNLDALAVYKVIKEHDFYNIDKLNDESLKFSVLSTAIADERIGLFLGISQKDDAEDTSPIVNPVNLERKSIQELTQWLFKPDAKGRTKIGESRNLRYLSAVVNNTHALFALRNGSSLQIAYQLTSDIGLDFSQLLFEAEAQVTEAAGMVATVAYQDDAYQSAKRILEKIKLIGRELKTKHEPENDEF